LGNFLLSLKTKSWNLEGKKTLVKFAGLTVFLNFLVKPAWLFLFDRKVQATLGNSEYGAYFSAFNLAFIASILLDLGMSYWNNRALAYDERKQRKYQQAIFTMKAFLSLIFLGFGGCITVISSLKGEALVLFWGAMMLQWFSHWLTFFRSMLTGIQKFGWDAFFSVLDRLLSMAGVGWLVWGGNLSASNFAWIQVAAYALSSVMLLMLLRHFHFRFQFAVQPGVFREIIQASLPFFLLVMSMSLYARLDGIMLDRVFHLPKEAGVYAAFFRLYEAGIIFPSLIAGVLTPLIARHLGQGKSINDILQTGTSWMLLPALWILGALIAYPTEIFEWMYHGETIDETTILNIFPLVGLVFFFHSIVLLYGATLTAMGELKWLIRWSLFAALCSMVLHVFLIPKFGAQGAGIATVLGHGWMALGCFWGVLQKTNLKESLVQNVGRILIFLLGMILFLFWNPLLFELGIFVWFFVLFTLAVILKLLNLRTFQVFLKRSS